jgi:geranylgeranyl pyrophosphate synthase
MKMKDFESAVDQFFMETRKESEEYIKKMIEDSKICAQLEGGKRLRQLLSLLTYKACTGGKESSEDYNRAMEGTVSMELAHTSSLLHDDIIDQDKQRRGKPALYFQSSISNSLLLGHKMLVLGHEIAFKHGTQFAKLYLETWRDALSGEIMEIQFNQRNFSKVFPLSDLFSFYMTVIDLKTAALFASACRLGAMEAYIKGDIPDKLTEFGREIGRAYQLTDDLVDLEKGEIIPSVILPLLERIEKMIDDSKRITKKILKERIKKYWKEIKEFYDGEIEKRICNAEKIIEKMPIPESIYKNMLFEAPRYLIKVKYQDR